VRVHHQLTEEEVQNDGRKLESAPLHNGGQRERYVRDGLDGHKVQKDMVGKKALTQAEKNRA